uniref:Uncharacterized protein n=1 Tax=Populus trichocarpa TaxID=3694 RepID=A0A2K1Y5Q3_POPTR
MMMKGKPNTPLISCWHFTCISSFNNFPGTAVYIHPLIPSATKTEGKSHEFSSSCPFMIILCIRRSLHFCIFLIKRFKESKFNVKKKKSLLEDWSMQLA